MNKLTLTLRYTRGVGDLSPYFEGLATGVARATRCEACGRSWFPPRSVCPQGHTDLRWLTLPGAGVVRAVTEGMGRLPFDARESRLVLALVAMEGADNLALGRIDGVGPVRAGDRVRLIPDTNARGERAWSAVFERSG